MVKRLAGIILTVLAFMITAATNAGAHHPTGGAGLAKAGPIRTIAAPVLQQGKWAVALQTEYTDFDSFSDEELGAFAEEGKDVHSTDSIYHTILGVGYGLSNDFTLSVKISYEYLNNIREAHHDEPEEVHIHGDAKGIGDLTVEGQYRFINDRERGFESSLLFGLKLPTGRTTDKDIGGERFETEFQPGTGSWNPLFGIAATRRFGSLSLDANLLYTIATEGAQDTDLGDFFNYNIALSYRAVNKRIAWDLILEANGEWKQKEKVAGIKDENSGGNTIFLSPGTRVTWDTAWSAYLSVGFPVVQNLKGVQSDTDIRTVVGITVGF